jgi:rsbT co-antagonist protein RsbR
MGTAPITRSVSGLATILRRREDAILAAWIEEMSVSTRRDDLMKDSELRAQCSKCLRLMRQAAEAGGNFESSPWDGLRDVLGGVSRSRAQQGFTSSETATFVFSAKRPLFVEIREEYKDDAESLASEMWAATELLDAMGLYTTEVYQKSREDVIRRQQEELLELSTPVVKLWRGVLALPVIGTLDSARTQVVMESLLEAIVRTDSRVAIIDISGVPTVDTVVAQHLLKTITAARLMGADCIISGIRPQIAQTIVHLGIDLGGVITKSKLSDAFKVALDLLEIKVDGNSAA